MDEFLTEERIHRIDQLAKEYAHAKSIRTYLEHYRQSKIALLMKDAQAAGHEKIGEQEREARAHPEYIKLLMGLKEAIETEEKAKWKLQTEQNLMEQWRTIAATERAEMALR